MTTFTPPGSIAVDGSVDVSAPLAAWIASVPDGSAGAPNVVSFQPGATYWTESPLLVKHRHHLIFDGQGATFEARTTGASAANPDPVLFLAWPRTRTRWTFVECGDITVTGMVLRGGHPNAGTGPAAYVAALEAQHGFDLIGCTDVLVTGNEIYDVYGDCVYIAGGRRYTITRNYMRRNGRQGFAISSGSQIWFTWNDQADIRRAHVDLEADFNDAVIDDVHIEDNVFGANKLLTVANGGYSHRVSNIYIRRNRRDDPGGGVPVIFSNSTAPGGKRGPWWVEDNDFGPLDGSPRPGFEFINSHEVHFRANRAVFPPSQAMTAIRCVNVGMVDVADNDLTGYGTELSVESDQLPSGTTVLVDT